MKIVRTDAFKKDFQKLPKTIQEKFENKVKLFISNIKHPSLRVKKMKGHKNRWEASVDMFYKFTFEIHQGFFLFRRIGPHDDIYRNVWYILDV